MNKWITLLCIVSLQFGGWTASAANAIDTSSLPKVKSGDPLPANLFVELAKAVNPAVVNVFTTYLPRGRMMGHGYAQDPFFEMFEQFMNPGGGGGGGGGPPQQSLGSGFIIREDGLILTNNHVVDRASVIKVQISENTKESFDARIIGKDAKTDIALIKIDTKKKLPYVKLGSSADVQVGEWVAAFGNPYGYGHSMTKGIISALGRTLDDLNLFPFMQTDASINPGNSGGPLVNTQGQVIGVNTAIDARAQGIGFVIPIDNVKSILPQLEKEGGIKRGFIGIQMADIDAEAARSINIKNTEGALVVQVFADTPAEKGGMQPYDLVVGFGDTKITSTRDLNKAVDTTPVGTAVNVKVIRNGKPKSLSVKVGGNQELKEVNAGSGRNRPRREQGIEAPFDAGFVLAEYSPIIAQEFGLPKLGQVRPVVVAVRSQSEAARQGLAPGDIILDVNRMGVSHPKEVVKALKKNTINIFRVLKQDRVVLMSLRLNG
jgi:serine protease Do